MIDADVIEYPVQRQLEQQIAADAAENRHGRETEQRVDVQADEGEERAIGAIHHDIAVREIDDPRHAERQGQTDRHQGVDAAE